MRRSMTAAVLCYGVALLLLPPAFGNHGLWAALMVLNAARGIFMARLAAHAEAKAAG